MYSLEAVEPPKPSQTYAPFNVGNAHFRAGIHKLNNAARLPLAAQHTKPVEHWC